MSKEICHCGGQIIDQDDMLVCTKCATVQENYQLVADQPNYNPVSTDIRDSSNNSSSSSGNKSKGRKTYFNRNSNTLETPAKFENSLTNVCTALGLGPSTRASMINHYNLACTNWSRIKRIDPGYRYVTAALAYIATRKEDKGFCLLDIGMKLDLKPYTIGAFTMKIIKAAGIIVNILPEFGYLDRGIKLLADEFKYTREESESLKRLTCELIRFCKLRGIAEGRTPTSTYCACLYMAQQHYSSMTPSSDKCGDIAGSDYNQNKRIKTLATPATLGKRRQRIKTSQIKAMKPYFDALYTQMKAPLHATRQRIRELELHLYGYSSNSQVYSTIINENNMHQYIPLLLKDFFITTCNDDDQIERDLESDNDEQEEEEQEEEQEENVNVNENVNSNSNNNNSFIVDDENPNDNQNNNLNVNSKNKRKRRISDGGSSNSKTTTTTTTTTSTTDEDIDILNFLNESTSTSKRLVRGKRELEVYMMKRTNNTPPPSYVSSVYKSILRRLRLVAAKYRLVDQKKYQASNITESDKTFFKTFKRFYPTSSSRQDAEIEKLLINDVQESVILEGYKDFTELELEKYLKDNSDLFQLEELDECDIPENEFSKYIKSKKEIEFILKAQKEEEELKLLNSN